MELVLTQPFVDAEQVYHVSTAKDVRDLATLTSPRCDDVVGQHAAHRPEALSNGDGF